MGTTFTARQQDVFTKLARDVNVERHKIYEFVYLYYVLNNSDLLSFSVMKAEEV